MSLIEVLSTKLGTYECLDECWMQFVDDHKATILATSTTHVPSLAYMRPYEYNLEYYLKSIGFNVSAAWIVRLINEIITNQDFISVTSIEIPDLSELKKLFEMYRTIKAQTT